MPTRSPFESPRDAAAADVLRLVVAARRRLRTVATVRLVAIAAPAGVAAGAVLVTAGWAPAETPRVLGVLGAIAAAAWAAVRTPSLAAVARMLDARLGLRDRVAAALQLQFADGPIAALVARDAAARLVSVRMTTVFPLAMGRMPAVAIALAVASMAWPTSSRVGTPEAAPRTASSDSGGTDDASSRTRRDSRRAATTAEPRASGRPATPQPAESRAADDRRDTTREAFAPAAASDRPQDAPPPVASPRGAPVNTAGTSQQTAAAPAAAAATGRTGRSGAGAGSTASGGLTAGAGGAAPGGVLASRGSEPAAPVVSGSFRVARANAEAALARDVIPPDYRDHVRAYFRALPTPSTGAGGTR